MNSTSRKSKSKLNKNIIKRVKKERQFAKKICFFAMFVVMFSLIMNGILAWFDKQILSDVTIAVIGTFGGFVTAGYFTLSGIRDLSLNKHGMYIDENNEKRYMTDKNNECFDDLEYTP